MWPSDLEDENGLVAIWRQTINGSRVNNGEEGSYKYNKMLYLTSVQMQELLSIIGLCLNQENKEVRSSYHNCTALARYRRTISFSG